MNKRTILLLVTIVSLVLTLNIPNSYCNSSGTANIYPPGIINEDTLAIAIIALVLSITVLGVCLALFMFKKH